MVRIILEMANNHGGFYSKAEKIIEEFAKVAEMYPIFDFTMKFQARNLSSIIHPKYLINQKIPYIEKFIACEIDKEELYDMKKCAEEHGFATLCTPFDEMSVEDMLWCGFNEIKIGSCSATDWPLLNAVADTKLPVILSTGGKSFSEINEAITFFQHREIPLKLMHCVGIYPSTLTHMILDRITTYKAIYPHLSVGLSSHESGNESMLGALAIAKGATLLERHVDIEHENINAYSATPSQLINYLENARNAVLACRSECAAQVRKLEEEKLATFKRGIYVKRDIVQGETISRSDLFFAMPLLDGQLDASACSKYNYFVAQQDIKKNEPLFKDTVNIHHNRENVWKIVQSTKSILDNANIPTAYLPKQMEISHHYGIDNFDMYGMCMFTIINEVYCKKILVLQHGQSNPGHVHKNKTETFFVLHGKCLISVDGGLSELKKGEMITIYPGQVHAIYAKENTVIEEISTNHDPKDSVYSNDKINKNMNRKTMVYHA